MNDTKRYWLCCVLLVGLVAGCASPGDHTTDSEEAEKALRRALAEELLEAMQYREGYESVWSSKKESKPPKRPAVREVMGWDNIKHDIIAVYADVFTVDEMKQFIAFYRSPMGCTLVEKQREVAKGMAALGGKWFKQVRERAREIREATPPKPQDCRDNLRQIHAAKQQLALAMKLEKGAIVTAKQVARYIKGGQRGFEGMKCPYGGSYSINPIGTKPTCSAPDHDLSEQKLLDSSKE